jgi:membrane protease YdiL (CAAX protease family)
MQQPPGYYGQQPQQPGWPPPGWPPPGWPPQHSQPAWPTNPSWTPQPGYPPPGYVAPGYPPQPGYPWFHAQPAWPANPSWTPQPGRPEPGYPPQSVWTPPPWLEPASPPNPRPPSQPFVPAAYGTTPGRPEQPGPQPQYAPPAWPPNPAPAPQPYGVPPAYTWFQPYGGTTPAFGSPAAYGPSSWAPAQGYPYFPGGFAPASIEAPGKSHPPVPPRSLSSLAGRALPELYAIGWLLTVSGLTLLGTLVLLALLGLPHPAGLALFLAAIVSLAAVGGGCVAAALAQGSQRRADGWLDYSGPSPFLVVGAWLGLSNAAGLLILGLFKIIGFDPATSVQALLLLLVNGAAYIAIVQVVAVRPGALTWSDMIRPRRLALTPSDWFDPSTWSQNVQGSGGGRIGRLLTDTGIGAGLAFPLVFVTLVLAAFLVTLLGMQDVSSEAPLPVTTDWDLWITLIAAAIVAPIGEEIFFRGFATNAWARSLERNSALVRATIFFAAIHIINVDITGYADLSIILRAAFLAVAVRVPVAWVLAWVYTRRRSIFASTALHMTYNALLILLAYWALQYGDVVSGR